MTVTPTDAEIIMEAIESRLLDVHTALPGRIVEYDSVTQTAEIVLQIKRIIESQDGALEAEELPHLYSVPIIFPRCKDFFISFPLAADDGVWIMFSETSLDQWRSKGVVTVPGDIRRHTLTGAVAYTGFFPNAEAISNVHDSAMVMGREGQQRIFIHEIGEDASLVQVTDTNNGLADDFVAQGAKVKSELDDVKSDLDSIKTNFDAHVHTGVLTGGASSGPPVAPFPSPHTPASVASSNLKADD